MQKLQLFIPEPCHENWHQMTPTDQGRFCNACAKVVVDFSMMTDTEVLNYFTSLTHEKVCGRALPDQLNRTISYPKEPKKRLFWYWNYMVMFFMFFGKGNSVKAQGGMKANTECSPVKANEIRGEIATSEVVADRSIALAKEGTKTRIRLGQISTVSKDYEALYLVDGELWIDKSIDVINPDDIDNILVLQATEAIALFGPKGVNGAIVITTRKAKEIKMKEVVVNSEYGTKSKRSMLGGIGFNNTYENSFLSDTITTVKTLLTESVKIYPNPVQRNNGFSVQLKLKQPGNNYSILITDAAGKIILQQKFNAAAKDHTENITGDRRWAAGIYYIRIFDTQNKFVSRSSFIFQ